EDAEAATNPRDVARRLEDVERAMNARGLHEDGVHVALKRARALLAAHETDDGITVLVRAIRDAERRGMAAVVPEALAALANAHVAAGRLLDGLEAFSRASESAERRGDRRLAAELNRCAGHAALNANRPADARRAWSRALELLDGPVPVTLALKEPE